MHDLTVESDVTRPTSRSAGGREPVRSGHAFTGHRGAVIASVVAVASGMLVALLTGRVVVVVLAVLAVLVSAMARHVGWRVASATTVLTAMVAQVCYLRLTPLFGWSLGASDILFWTVAGAAGVVALAIGGTPTVSRAQLETFAFVMIVPVAGATAYAVKMVSSGGSWISWAMNNDVAFRTLLVRFIVEDRGIRADRGYADPLTDGLLAAWTANEARAGGLARTIHAAVYSGAEIWILLWLAVSALCSLTALRAAKGGRAYRAGSAVAAGLLPWTWFVSGSGFELGFQNVVTTLLVVMLAWVLWTHRETHPAVCLSGLLMATLAAAMAWAPLALIPLAWSAYTAVTERSKLLATPMPARLLPVAALSVGIAYGALVTVPETLASGTGGLSGDGNIQAVSWRWSLYLALAGLAATILWRRRLSSTLRWGLWVSAAASALVIAYLLYQRRNSPALWGYYPMKFTWLTVSAGLLVAVAETAAGFSRLRAWWSSMGVVAVAVVLALLVMDKITPPWAPGSRFTPVALAQNERNDRAVRPLFTILRTHPKSFVAGYSTGRWTGARLDGFINFWLFQVSAPVYNDPIRFLAYAFDPTDAPTACHEVPNMWGSGVEVWTRNAKTARAYARSCSPEQVAVRFTPAPTTTSR